MPPKGQRDAERSVTLTIGRRWTLVLGNATFVRLLGTHGWNAPKATKTCRKRRSHAARSDRLATAPVP